MSSDNKPVDRILIKQVFDGEEIDVIYRRSKEAAPAGTPTLGGHGYMPPFEQRTYVDEGVVVEQDRAVKLRDGTTIYVDIYRPEGTDLKVPAILSYCFYGKRAGYGADHWNHPGVVEGTHSKATMAEGPDPMYWCKQGYAVINIDPRGARHSEGQMSVWGPQLGRDGYDIVEWAAAEPWCNGKIGMYGNSGLAMSQFWTAIEQPPHLAAIAPWEGSADIYREFACEGGIPERGFNNWVFTWLGSGGRDYIEDYVAMHDKYPLINNYWKSKKPDFSKITVPAYITAGWSHLHLRGSVDAYNNISSKYKWLRAHREFEWPDGYSWWNLEDLKRFFDRFLRDVRNGWEMTPPVRLEVMDAYDNDFQTNRPEKAFPLERTKYTKLYLNATSSSLGFKAPKTEGKAVYDSIDGEANFDIKFEETTEITGYMKLRLWVEAEAHDDMDLFVTVQKLDADGNWLPTSVLDQPHPGAWGKMRVSHRELDEQASTDYRPIQTHSRQLKLKPKEIVPVEIEIYPHSKIWHAGEQLRLRIAGRYIREGWPEPFAWKLDNKGGHIIHAGGRYDSYLQIPVIPAKSFANSQFKAAGRIEA